MVYIASDHAGFEIKQQVIEILKDLGIWQYDFGPFEIDPNDDYPFYAFALSEKVAENPESKGILVCSTGGGMCIAANKVKGIRAAEAASPAEAVLIREHNNANVLILAKIDFHIEVIRQIVEAWYFTPFSNEERHVRRLKEISDYENGNTPSPTGSKV